MVNNKLREVRKKVGMSISELARRTETSRQTITNIELNGQEPGVTLGLRIAKALNVDIKEIFFTDNVIHGLQDGVVNKTA